MVIVMFYECKLTSVTPTPRSELLCLKEKDQIKKEVYWMGGREKHSTLFYM